MSLKRGKIGPRLLLITNRKSCMHFRLVPKSTTLDDLECHYALCFKTCASFRAHHKNLNEDRPILSATKILDFGNIRFMQIFVGVPWRGASNNSGVIENVDATSLAP